jgi:tetratricopeptide (TPR) repeat protein
VPVVELSNAEPEVAEVLQAAMQNVQAEPRNGSAWGKFGMLLLAHDYETQSVEAFRAAERFDSENPKWPHLQGLTLVMHEPDTGLACLERAAAKSPDDRPEPRLRLAEALLDRGRTSEAQTTLAAVSIRHRENPRLKLILARVAAEREDWTAVLDQTSALLNEPAARKSAAVLRAGALRRLGRTAEADAEAARSTVMPEDEMWDDRYAREVLELQVGGNVDLRKGIDLLKAGYPLEAVAALERAAAKLRNPLPARLQLGRALNASGNPAVARQVLTDVVQRDQNLVEAWFQLGYAQFALGDPKSAADSFEHVVKLKPDHALGYFNLGQARKKLNDGSAAASAFEAALRCRPDHQPSRQALAELRARK